MRSPFGSEARAFRLVLLACVSVGVIAAAAALGGPRVAVPVWGATAAVAAVAYLHPRPRRRLLRTAPAHLGPPQERRLLVLAQALPTEAILAQPAAGADRVLVVSAPVVPALRSWVSDLDGPRERARRLVEGTVSRLRLLGADATGAIGDEDPLQALEDALRTFGGDGLLVLTAPGRRGEQLAARVRERLALPVTHLAA